MFFAVVNFRGSITVSIVVTALNILLCLGV
jgi:hypothetical protein